MSNTTFKIHGIDAVNAFIREFEIKVKNQAKSARTLTLYKTELAHLRNWTNVKELEKRIIEALLEDKEISENTRFLRMSIFKVFARWYSEATGIHVSLVDLPKIRRETSNRRAFSLNEFNIIFDDLKEFNNPRFEWIFKFMLVNGIRVSEFENINWEDFKQRKINGEFWSQKIKTAKSQKERRIFIPSSLAEDSKFRTMQEDFQNLKLDITAKTIKNIFGEFSHFVKARHPELKDLVISAHVLRHCFITNLMRKGFDIYQAAKIVGHSSPQMIELTYWTLDEEDYIKAMDKMLMEQVDVKELSTAEIVINSKNDVIANLKTDNNTLRNELERLKNENASLRANNPYFKQEIIEEDKTIMQSKISSILEHANNNLKLLNAKAYNRINEDTITDVQRTTH